VYKKPVYTLVNGKLATSENLHIENSKNCKRWYHSAAHWHTVSV